MDTQGLLKQKESQVYDDIEVNLKKITWYPDEFKGQKVEENINKMDQIE